MRFKSEAQRKAVMSKFSMDNKFSKRTLFHGTVNDFKENINKHGLLPAVDTGVPVSWQIPGIDKNRQIHFTDEFPTALVYGKMKSQAAGHSKKYGFPVYEAVLDTDSMIPDSRVAQVAREIPKNADESLDRWHIASSLEKPIYPKRLYEIPPKAKSDKDLIKFETMLFDRPEVDFAKELRNDLVEKLKEKYMLGEVKLLTYDEI